MTRRMVQRGAFLLMAAALVLGISRIPAPAPAPEPSAPDDVVYVYNGYAAKTDAAFDAASLDRAAYRFQHLHDLYFTGRTIFLAVVPDKAQFTVPPEGYTPAGAAETADYLCGALDFLTPVDIAAGLTLADYYRTDPHWRQEQLHPTADALLTAMGAPVSGTRDETLCALEGAFHGSYWGKTEEPLEPDTLSYLTSPVLEGCTVHNYETDTDGGVYDFTAAQGAPYDLFLSGSRSLLRIDNPDALSDRTLVVFRDSFGSSIIPLLAESYRTVYAVDIRYLSSDRLGRVVDFPNDADVLLLYSATVLQNSITLK